MCRTACLRLLFLLTYFDLTWTLAVSSMTFVLMQYVLQTYKSTSREFELFVSCLIADPSAQTVKTVFSYLLT